MKPPFFRLWATCDNEKCRQGEFFRESKVTTYKSSDGRVHSREDIRCPLCFWSYKIETIEEVRT